MNDDRSTNACEPQNSPTWSVVNDDTTSGAFGPPARSAWLILSSVMLETAFTWMLGCAFSKASMLPWIALISLGALHPCQKVIVVSAFGSSFAPPDVLPVHAEASARAATAASAAPVRRRDLVTVGPVIGCSPGRGRSGDRQGGDGVPGCARGRPVGEGVEDVVAGERERRVQRAGEHRVGRHRGEVDGGARDRELRELGADPVEEALATGGQH